MHRSALVVLVALLLLLAACDERQPLSRGRAAAIAGNVCLADQLVWGEPIEVLPPAASDAAGRSWWQVRYYAPNGSAPRVVLVDDASGWGRRPGADYAVRVRPAPRAVAAAAAVQAQPGSAVLILVEPALRNGADVAALEHDAVRLNQAATAAGMPPLFQARRDAGDRVSLLYGWQGDSGIAMDEALRDWVVRQGDFAQARWADLLER
jgi:hypothetical protein